MAFPNWFYDPNQPDNYGNSHNAIDDPNTIAFGDEQVPQGVFYDYITKKGFGGMGRRDQWAQGLYGRAQTGYQAAQRMSPTLKFRDYLRTALGGHNLQNMYASLDDSQRGQNPSAFRAQGRFIGLG